MSLAYQCIICNGRGVLGTGSCPSCICSYSTVDIHCILDEPMESMTKLEMNVWNAYVCFELAKKELKNERYS